MGHPATDRPNVAFASTTPRRIALWSLVGCSALGGLVARVVVARSVIGRVDADEAMWGLMARHAAHGHLGAFYWGQAYGGTQEVAVVGALFAVAGTHVFLMRLVPILLGAATAFVVWRIGRRTTGELPAIVAACLAWIWPPYVIWKLDVWHGFYGSGLLYAALIILFALRLDERGSRRDAAIFGLLLGLAFWQTLQIVPIAVPALAWLTIRAPRVWRHAWVAAPAALLGASPWLVSNLRHSWWSLNLPDAGGASYFTRLRGGLDGTIPMQLSLRVPFSSEWLFGPALSGLIYATLVAAFLAAGWRARRRRISLLFLIAALFPFLYALSGLTSVTTEPRYVVVVVPALVVLVAAPATTLARAALVLVVAGALSTAVLGKWIAWSDANADTTLDGRTFDVAPAIRALDRAGVDRVYTDFAIAYRITFETRERVIASEVDLATLKPVRLNRVLPAPLSTYSDRGRFYASNRQPAYDRAVRGARRHAYLLLAGEPTSEASRRLLVRNGYAASTIGPFLLVVSPRQR